MRIVTRGFFSDDESLEQFESNCRLCVALWGRLDGVHANDEEVDHETEEASYLHRIARRHAVADWLSITGMKRVESSGEKVGIFCPRLERLLRVFSLLGLFGQVGLFAFD